MYAFAKKNSKQNKNILLQRIMEAERSHDLLFVL